MTTFSLPQEHILGLKINETASVGLICTEEALRELIVGYLYNEGLIRSLEEIRQVNLSPDHSGAEVLLDSGIGLPDQQVRPSGLGGHQLGMAPSPAHRPVRNRYSLEFVRSCAKHMDEEAVKYAQTGGMHCSALFDPQGLLSLFEDIGRHNTLDKIAGDCLLRGIEGTDTLLITSGRISSDMVRKAARLGASVIASYSTPTQKAYDLAKEAGLTLIGYLKKARAQIYCAEERVL